MLRGIGVDICKISRMSKCIKNDRFLKRVFTEEEIEYASSKPCPARHFASAFAAREAFSKASGVNLSRVVFQGVSVKRGDDGPYLKLREGKIFSNQFKDSKIHLSLSHDGDYSIAFVVVEE